MNVLFINDDTTIGGAEKSLLLLIGNLDKDKFNTTLLVDKKNVRLIERITEKNFNYIAISFSYGNPLKNLFEIFKNLILLNRIINDKHIDLLYSNTVRANKFVSLYKLLFFSKIKSIWHVRDMGAKWRLVDRIITPLLTDRLIVVSNAVGRYHERVFRFYKNLLQKISVVYNASDIIADISSTSGMPELKDKYDLADSTLLGCIGRIVRRKGYEYAIKAMPDILKRYPEVKLLIIGEKGKSITETGYLDSLKDLVKQLNIGDRVIFTGYIKDIRVILSNMNTVIVPSIDNDPCPRVVIEAMACAIPVIGTNVGGIPELIENGENGFIVDPEDPDQIAEKIMEILSDKDKYRSFCKYALSTAEKRFNVKTYAGEVERIMEELVYKQ